jgi:hypothetical protein
LQVLFAFNQQHLVNEKGALALASELASRPVRLSERVNQILGGLKPEPMALNGCLDELKTLKLEVDMIVSSRAGSTSSDGV